MSAITITDVAAAAGVSAATASRALSGHPSVLPATRDKVLAAADALHYRKDPIARALRAGSSNLLALVVTNLQNPAIQVLAEEIQSLGQDAGYDVVIATTGGEPDREQRLVEALTSRRLSGLFIMATDDGTSRINELAASGLPVVELIRLPSGLTAPAVVYDDHRAADLATTHLIELGHRRIAFVGGPLDTRSGRERHSGYVAAHQAAGVPIAEDAVWHGPFQASFGPGAIDELVRLADPVTAVVLANHEAAFAAMQAVSRHGIDVPEELSIVAIEDDPVLAWWHPPITSVDVSPRELARRAMANLLAAIRGDRSARPRDLVPVELVTRSSTRPL